MLAGRRPHLGIAHSRPKRPVSEFRDGPPVEEAVLPNDKGQTCLMPLFCVSVNSITSLGLWQRLESNAHVNGMRAGYPKINTAQGYSIEKCAGGSGKIRGRRGHIFIWFWGWGAHTISFKSDHLHFILPETDHPNFIFPLKNWRVGGGVADGNSGTSQMQLTTHILFLRRGTTRILFSQTPGEGYILIYFSPGGGHVLISHPLPPPSHSKRIALTVVQCPQDTNSAIYD